MIAMSTDPGASDDGSPVVDARLQTSALMLGDSKAGLSCKGSARRIEFKTS